MTAQTFSKRSLLRRVGSWGTMVVASMAFTTSAAQQTGPDSVAIQREAMHKLAFLAGHWSGPVTVTMGPGGPLHLTQTEEVHFKLDGLVLLIEGKSTDAAGNIEFAALATVAYDEDAKGFRIRATTMATTSMPS